LIPKKRIYTAWIFTLFFATYLFPSCAPVTLKQAPLILDEQKIADFISMAREQDAQVRSLISAGRLTIRKRGSETGLNVLMAGERDRDKIKIELTHSWGRPVVHILVHGKRFDIVSFVDKKFYLGSLGTTDPSGFFPGRLELDQIWAFVRAFPVVPKHSSAVFSRENQITLLNSNGGTVQVVDFCNHSNLPCRISFPEQGSTVLFSKFEQKGGTLYARKVELRGANVEGAIEMDLKQFVFNETIPQEIFQLEAPEGFEAAPLRGLQVD
jgi:hypothetical protein